MRQKRKINNIYVFYRISDNGFKNKIKPSYITKYNCLKNALSVFKGANVFFNVYIDVITDETDKLIHLLCDSRENTKITYLDTRSNGFSFRKVFEDACSLFDDDLIYFLEDDYLHEDDSLKKLIDAAEWNYTDYISLYDHPDKYDNNPTGVNKFCTELGENCNLFKTSFHHWKTTNSTTMTFAAFVDVLKRDKNIFFKHTETGYPYDFDIFTELKNEKKFLSTPIPSLSTHGETKFLSPFKDWEKISKGKTCCAAIITHKSTLTDKDEESFKQLLKVFYPKRKIKLIVPDNINLDYYKQYEQEIEICTVNNEWLSSIKEYNVMCCTKEFYYLFAEFDYVLIYQTDCWVFEDNLDYFIEKGYDWYGAPWPHVHDAVGNGGFSLRNVNKMIEITQSDKNTDGENEDMWFCLRHKKDMNICDLDTACNFSMEIIKKDYLRRIIRYPMGLHGRDMKKYWDSNGINFLKFKENNGK